MYSLNDHPLCYCSSLADSHCDFCTGTRQQLPRAGDVIQKGGIRYLVESVRDNSPIAVAAGAWNWIMSLKRPKGHRHYIAFMAQDRRGTPYINVLGC